MVLSIIREGKVMAKGVFLRIVWNIDLFRNENKLVNRLVFLSKSYVHVQLCIVYSGEDSFLV
jgi:hypothetical protein